MKYRIVTLASIIATLLVSACASTQDVKLVPEAEGVESVSVVKMSCDKPFVLTQDCSGFSGPKKKIVLNGIKIKIAGTGDGKTVMMTANSSQEINQGYEFMKNELLQNDLKIVKVTPGISLGTLMAYIIETDKPNYQLWAKHAL